MTAPKLTLLCGFLLILVGVVGALVAMTLTPEWWYGLMPSFIGIPVLLCGWGASKFPGGRLVIVIVASLLAISGIIGSFMPHGLNFSTPGSIGYVSSIFRLLTIIVCAGYLVLLLRRSFRSRPGHDPLQ